MVLGKLSLFLFIGTLKAAGQEQLQSQGPPVDDDDLNLRTEYSFKPHLKTVDKNCYECKVRYRDPKPKDLVMFLHALKYSVSEVMISIDDNFLFYKL